MDHEAGLQIVNGLHTQFADLARAIVNALNDGKIGPFEGMILSMKGMSVAAFVVSVLQGMDTATRKDILYTLEHGNWTLKEDV